jgi:predicted nuclease with TOPRIM domain
MRRTAAMSDATKPIEALEQRVKKLETDLRSIGNDVGKLKEYLNLLDRLKDVPQQIEALGKRISDLEQKSNNLDTKIDTRAKEVRDDAQASAKLLVDALEKNQIEPLSPLINAKASQARVEAEATAQGYVDALSANGGALFTLNTKYNTLDAAHYYLDGKHNDLSKQHEKLSAIVNELKNPTPATEIAKIRVEDYRRFFTNGQLDELKQALSNDQLEVLKEIASLLDPKKAEDNNLLSKMIPLAKPGERMAAIMGYTGISFKKKDA